LSAAGVLLVILGYAFRAPLLTGFANLWIVNDPPAKADAIVVLGGGIKYRPAAAAKLYREGYAPKVLTTDVALRPSEQKGLKVPERDLTRTILLQEGVPESAIERVGHAVRNTYQESLAVEDWAGAHNATRLLITTEIFHTRRVKWLFRKRFKNAGTEIRLVPVQPVEYAATNWWQVKPGLISFQNEWIKLPYYWAKY
jgi:uncharacterized SAM-binding protein YcdF (DUF218 family)